MQSYRPAWTHIFCKSITITCFLEITQPKFPQTRNSTLWINQCYLMRSRNVFKSAANLDTCGEKYVLLFCRRIKKTQPVAISAPFYENALNIKKFIFSSF